MEYMEFGSLWDEDHRSRFSFAECVEILRQSLSALVYLHGRSKPIAHRDLKPGNILVRQRDPLHVKLGDFGLAKNGSLESHCGTWTYAAPEVQPDSRMRGHTVAVDLWSLAVVILELAYQLPHPGLGKGMRWCEALVSETNGREPDGLIDILQRMAIIEASARDSAATCLSTLEEWMQPPAARPLQAHGDDSVFWPQQVSSGCQM
jgi:serine/threonine-protein kinase Chk2